MISRILKMIYVKHMQSMLRVIVRNLLVGVVTMAFLSNYGNENLDNSEYMVLILGSFLFVPLLLLAIYSTARIVIGHYKTIKTSKELKMRTNTLSMIDKARYIFDFFVKTYEYDHEKLEEIKSKSKQNIILERCASEVSMDGKGLCGELSYLLMRYYQLLGYRVKFIDVGKDCFNQEVEHACVGVHLGDRLVLVDPAYEMFDVYHRDYTY